MASTPWPSVPTGTVVSFTGMPSFTWSGEGSTFTMFARTMVPLADKLGKQTTVMIAATYLKTHRTAISMAAEKGRGRLTGFTNGAMNTKLSAICESHGRQLDLFVAAGQVSEYTGAPALPQSERQTASGQSRTDQTY